jgi:hypothetical protein
MKRFLNTAGVLRDLLESAIQDFQTDVSQFWRFLGGLDILPDPLQQKFLDSQSAFTGFLR